MMRPTTQLLFASLTVSALGFAACGGSSKPADTGGAGGEAGAPSTEPGPGRVIGYIPTWRSLNPAAYDLGALTHLNIAFANPTEDGTSDFDAPVRDAIGPLVEAAHAEGVLVLASIAGGSDAGGGAVAAEITADKVDAYVQTLLELVDRYELDGIDVDIEGEYVTATYEPFVKKLHAALPAGKLLTAAVSIKNGDSFSDAALAEYDFINVMAYDYCSWTDEPCDQAGYDKTVDDLRYWTVERGYPHHKTVLGVPFYGWSWDGEGPMTALTYAQILSAHPEAAKTEDWIVDGETTISHNSAATIEKKVELSKPYGGIMIWELGQDQSGEDSLLAVVKAAR